MIVILKLLYGAPGDEFLAKIAVEYEPGKSEPAVSVLALGEGWTVSDVVCAAGPRDQPFEERHSCVSIAIVTAGTFQYRSVGGCELMTPGSLLLGNVGQPFECGHEHGVGDRCISFQYAPDHFERIAADSGCGPRFSVLRMPPLRDLSGVVAQACAGRAGSAEVSWEELGVRLASRAIQLARGVASEPCESPPSAVARVTRIVRAVEHELHGRVDLAWMAREARLSPYHFLRTFERLTGLTPHQYVLRARLRKAAARLTADRARILDIALDSGFGDVSNFNRAFRTEFGVSPRVYRAGPSD